MKTTTTSTGPKEYQLEFTGEFTRCPGEAHTNAFIDHCSLCAPNWGRIPAHKPVDLEKAKAEHLDVRAGHLSDAQTLQMLSAEEQGQVELVSVTRKTPKGKTSQIYNVWRFR